MKRKIALALVIFMVAILAYLLAWPVPINPSAWTPPVAAELSGVYAQNSELSKIERLPVDGFAPEDVAIDDQDRIYCGTEDGRIFRRSEEHTSELQSRFDLVCRLLLEKKKKEK